MEKERIEQFLSTADSPETRDITELKSLYTEITGKEVKCDSDTCIVKMLTEVRKFYDKLLRDEAKQAEPVRRHTLKDGNHSFAPGGPANHNNDNTSDKEIDFYLKHFPHIKHLLN